MPGETHLHECCFHRRQDHSMCGPLLVMERAFSHWPNESLERDRHEVATDDDMTGVATCSDVI